MTERVDFPDAASSVVRMRTDLHGVGRSHRLASMDKAEGWKFGTKS